MEDYIYFRYMLKKLAENDSQSPEVLFESNFVRPILYIKNIWLNDELIEDWNTLLITQKLQFYNKIEPSITIASKKQKNTLYDFIKNTFIQQKLIQKIKNYEVACPKCHRKYHNLFQLDNFFMF